VTEGNIAIDDDLTAPVFSHYSGRVIELIAKLGDHVEPGAPLFEIQASEFVQARNDPCAPGELPMVWCHKARRSLTSAAPVIDRAIGNG
jgi:Barrel-sandwich domain of CusB or HlyD membrane-fusion